MSDLHCPARLTLATDRDLDLAALRPAAVYATGGAGRVADGLGARYDVLSGPLPAALEGVADQHRGEDVLVLVSPAELADLPRLQGRSAPVRVDIDADGWALES